MAAVMLASPASAQRVQPQLRVSPEAQAAGVAQKAGMLCLPNGSLRLRDFMPSAEAAQAELVAAHPLAEELTVTLSGMGGKLCARDYGMFGLGKRQSFTGEVSFRFEWTAAGQPRRAAVITVEAPRREPATAGAIFTTALFRLAGKIASER